MAAKHTFKLGDITFKVYEKSFTVNGFTVYPNGSDYPSLVEAAMTDVFNAGRRSLWPDFKKLFGAK